MEYRSIRIISGKGTGPGQFAEALRGITVDPQGAIYAVGDREVKVFNADGALLRKWPTDKPGYCVSLDRQGIVHVGEVGQIEKFDANGKRLALWQDEDRLAFVTAIGFIGDHLIVADAKDRCIRRFDRDGRWVNNIGKDNKTKGFLIPNGQLDFSVDEQGIIHATNPAKHRVERYSTGGELLGHFGRFGTRRPEDFPGCCNPTNLTLTGKGQVVVTEKAGPRVKIYSAEGELLAVIGAEEFDANCKNMDVATDLQGRVYVVDTVRLNIHVFAPVKADNEAASKTATPATQGETRR